MTKFPQNLYGLPKWMIHLFKSFTWCFRAWSHLNQHFTRNSLLLHVPGSLSTPAACPQGRPLLLQLIVQARQTLQSRGQIRCGWPHEFSMFHPKSPCFWETPLCFHKWIHLYIFIPYIEEVHPHGAWPSLIIAQSTEQNCGIGTAFGGLDKQHSWFKTDHTQTQQVQGIGKDWYLGFSSRDLNRFKIIHQKSQNFKHFGNLDQLTTFVSFKAVNPTNQPGRFTTGPQKLRL